MAPEHIQLPSGPTIWPPATTWPATVHTGIRHLKAVASHSTMRPEQGSTLLVAVSGGADSLALAVLAAETQRVTGIRFGAIILDHHLQAVTAEVAQRTKQICLSLGLHPVITDDLKVVEAGEGLEAAARRARYDAFVRLAQSVEAVGVLTGHTADDQAEQVLLGLARGSGLRSIAGIRKFRQHSDANDQSLNIGRPLLEMRRTDTETICHWAGLQYFEDPMNNDSSVARIRVRHHLLPTLRDPTTGLGAGVFTGLVTTAALAADDLDVLEALAADTYRALAVETRVEGVAQVHFPLLELQGLKPAILRRVVALAVQYLGAPQPSAERLAAVEQLVFPPIGRASSAGPVQLEGHVSVYRTKVTQEYAKLLVIRSATSD